MDFPDPGASLEEWSQWWRDHQDIVEQMPEISDQYKANIEQLLMGLQRASDGDEPTAAAIAEIWEQVRALSRILQTLALTYTAHEAMKAEAIAQRDQVASELHLMFHELKQMNMSSIGAKVYTWKLYHQWRQRHRKMNL